MKTHLFIFLLLSTLKLTAQNASLIGQPAPNLLFPTLLNTDTEQAELADFAGKVVILDYWATWCRPCLASFPHLSALRDTFSDQLAVITITSESRERIDQFLEKGSMDLPVAIDEGPLSEAFPHRIVPHTVVIDPQGVVVAITSAGEISRDMIEDVLAGDSLQVAEKRDVIDFDPNRPLAVAGGGDYQIAFSPYQPGYPSFANLTGGSGAYANRRIYAVNLAPKSLYEIAHHFPVSVRTVVEVSDKAAFKRGKESAVCFDLIVPEKLGDRRFEIMQDQLDIYFGYAVSIESRRRPVKVLRRLDTEAEVPLVVSDANTESSMMYSGAGLSMTNSPFKTVADFLESQFNLPVVDETGLTEQYDLELPWYNEAPERIHDELKKIGLELTDDERDIEVLVIGDKL